AAPAGDERDDALHEVRKAARRARYAAEIAQEYVGKPARRSARRARDLQDRLGAQHDGVVRRETLRRLALQAELDGESTFTYGRLHALEQVATDEAELAAGMSVDRATARRHRRWMD
ncbi:CHAD domain-containing protein, partial [Cellulomonas sp. P5_C6]